MPRSPRAEGEAAEEAALLEPWRVVRQAARTLPARARAVRARWARVDLRPPGLGAPPGPDERADPDDPHPEQRRRERRGRVRGLANGVSVRAAGAAARPRGGLGRGRAVGGGAAGLGTGRVRATPRIDRRDPAWRPRQPEGAAPPGDPAQDPRGTRRLLPRVPGRHAGARGPRLAHPDRRHRQEDRLGAAAVLLQLTAPADRPPHRPGDAPGRDPLPEEPAPRECPRPGARACSSRTRCSRRTST